MFKECLAASDSPKAFHHALQARGYTLAKGDRRGHVAIDFKGEVFALSKWLDIKAKDLRSRLGDFQTLPTVFPGAGLVPVRVIGWNWLDNWRSLCQCNWLEMEV